MVTPVRQFGASFASIQRQTGGISAPNWRQLGAELALVWRHFSAKLAKIQRLVGANLAINWCGAKMTPNWQMGPDFTMGVANRFDSGCGTLIGANLDGVE